MAAVGFLVLVLGLVALGLWANVVAFRYSADKARAIAPDGERYDVLVHHDGVAPYVWPDLLTGLIGHLRPRRGTPWRCAVAGRAAPYPGEVDLLREVLDDQEEARRRGRELVRAIEAGERPW